MQSALFFVALMTTGFAIRREDNIVNRFARGDKRQYTLVFGNRAVNPNGTIILLCLFVRRLKLSKIGCAVALAAEAFNHLDKIRFTLGIGLGIAFTVEASLPLAHHTEHTVIKNHGDNRQIVTDCRARLVQIHMERAVARDMHHAFFGYAICAPMAAP